MQNSRHERALLVGVSYFIGGLTAFIAFGVQTGIVDTSSLQTASVITAQSVAKEPASPSAVSDPVPSAIAEAASVRYQNGLLEVETMDGVQVLSFDPAVTGFSVTSDFTNQGFHYQEPVTRVSPSGQFVFFCENQTPGSVDCKPFVFDALRGIIYPVTVAGEQANLNSDLLDQATFVGDELSIDNLRSISPLSPWELVYR